MLPNAGPNNTVAFKLPNQVVRDLESQLQQILILAVQYPALDYGPSFFQKRFGRRAKQRYELWLILWLNWFESVYRETGPERFWEVLTDMINIDEIIWTHGKNLTHVMTQDESKSSYPDGMTKILLEAISARVK